MSIPQELLYAQINNLIDELKMVEAENARLKAEVERLTKAGDKMADRLIYQGYPATVPAWNAAKEGKQP